MTSIKSVLLFLATSLVLATSANAQLQLNGAGATFPYVLYDKWFSEYQKADPAVRFNYQSIGSGGGIKQITAQTVDFGATDAFMKDSALKAVPSELLHIPTVMGAVVVAYNIPGITTSIKLTPDVLADIFLGKITKWNDVRITSLNPGVSFPDAAIASVHRSDGSGTTAIFVDYLAKVSDEWKTKVGTGTSVNWPAGLGGKGNEGVAGQLKQTPNSVGYVELAYAEKNGLEHATLKNKSGNFVKASFKGVSAAAAGFAKETPADLRVSITNAAGADAYPISGYTWILAYRDQKDQKKGEALAKFLWWAVHDGEKFAEPLYYAMLPKEVLPLVEDRIKLISFGGKPFITLPTTKLEEPKPEKPALKTAAKPAGKKKGK